MYDYHSLTQPCRGLRISSFLPQARAVMCSLPECNRVETGQCLVCCMKCDLHRRSRINLYRKGRCNADQRIHVQNCADDGGSSQSQKEATGPNAGLSGPCPVCTNVSVDSRPKLLRDDHRLGYVMWPVKLLFGFLDATAKPC